MLLAANARASLDEGVSVGSERGGLGGEMEERSTITSWPNSLHLIWVDLER